MTDSKFTCKYCGKKELYNEPEIIHFEWEKTLSTGVKINIDWAFCNIVCLKKFINSFDLNDEIKKVKK